MIANSRSSSERTGSSIVSALPTRIITYAWGEHYVDIVLSLTIPALLAPGNLPYVAACTSCELVILTEERFFPVVAAHPSVALAKQLCLVRLISLDDLIAQKDKYGMALTYALHRGFRDLGPAMTQSWQIFLNADFVLAEGSLRSVMLRLAQGERLIASPSYCVNASEVSPTLRELVGKREGSLVIPPRELAAIALANRHNTIRGKTVNQSEFTLRYMDQFYWLVDDRTLLGHQMPIAIVGIRPERHIPEPSSYWDHGLMREYCPTAEMCVLGDSDEFLMLELREKDVAQDQIEAGRPTAKIIAGRMITFLTPYQRDCARFELTLHSGEIPPEAATARQKLCAYVDAVLSELPTFLPSHVDHPQWNYHLPGFVEFRHKFLSERLGSLTETLPPPVFSSELDRAWWKLDGMEKRAARRQGELRGELRDFVNRELRLIQETANSLEQARDPASATTRAEFDSTLEGVRNRLALRHCVIARELDKYFKRDGLVLIGSNSVHLEHWQAEGEREHSRQISEMARDLSQLYEMGIQLAEIEFQELQVLRNEYRLMLPPVLQSAAVPFVITEQRPSVQAGPESLLRRIFRPLFFRTLRDSVGLTPVFEIVKAATGTGASRVLHIGWRSGMMGIACDGLSGSHVRVSTAGMRSGNFGKAFPEIPQFDLCICDLDLRELLEFPSIIAATRPFMVKQGIIIGYHWNWDSAKLPSDTVLTAKLPPKDTVRIYRTGSHATAFLLQRLIRANSLYRSREYSAIWLSLLKYVIAAPIVLLSSGYKFLRRQGPLAAADLNKNIVIEIVVG